jgi:hypothetical protein
MKIPVLSIEHIVFVDKAGYTCLLKLLRILLWEFEGRAKTKNVDE